MEEHVPSDKMTAGGAGRVDRFFRFVIRVQKGEHGGTAPIPLIWGRKGKHEKGIMCGKHNLCEHLPTDKMIASGARRVDRFCRFAIQARKVKGCS